MLDPVQEQKEVIKKLIRKGILMSEEDLKLFDEENLQTVKGLLNQETTIVEQKLQELKNQKIKNKNCTDPARFQDTKKEKEDENIQRGTISVIKSYAEEGKKLEITDFVKFFKSRYKKIEKLLQKRQKLQNLISISRLSGKKQKEAVSIIGLVVEKEETKNGNIILTIEDITGMIKVIVNKNKQELYTLARDTTLDEVIGITGMLAENAIFANSIILPDVPLIQELKKSNEEVYAIFLSDIHVGSKNFLEERFIKFLKWINGEIGTQTQRDIAMKINYLFILGDLVDGIGVYPNQNEELVIQDIYKQYEKCAELLNQIPKYIRIILCPGNHDAGRISEPQPPLSKEIAQPLLDINNITSVSNPSLINIHSSEHFPGFNILLYHGYSFDYYAANIDSIRQQGGYDRADLIMKFLLQRRHLAPTHSSSLYIPGDDDPLVIEQLPDFFVTGHIHKTSVSNYRNITLISGSCWQSKTSFQEKVGHNPEPCKVPIVNLQTRNIKIMTF